MDGADMHGTRTQKDISFPSGGLTDKIALDVFVLLQRASSELARSPGTAKATIASASSLLAERLGEPPAAEPRAQSPLQGGLASWQVRRVSEFVARKLSRPLRVADLSRVVGLSETYFSHAFRRSFGETPHAFLTRRRIERGAELLLTTDRQLCDIAHDCGFADQAHFGRHFRRSMGISPAAWRREQRAADRVLQTQLVSGARPHSACEVRNG
jgi:AraC family transcriptional regulator